MNVFRLVNALVVVVLAGLVGFNSPVVFGQPKHPRLISSPQTALTANGQALLINAAPIGVEPAAWARIQHQVSEQETGPQSPDVPEDGKIYAGDATAGDNFGYALAVSADTLVVGAPSDADRGSYAGSVYIFERNLGGANAWGQRAKLYASDASVDANFGIGVAIDGDTVLVGAYFEAFKRGSAYIFDRNQGGANAWGQVKKIVAPDRVDDDRFGLALAIDADTAVVSAIFDDAGAGSAYIFERNLTGPNAWGFRKKLLAADRASGDLFGRSVSLSGDRIIAGAPSDDTTAVNTGSAYLFERNLGGPNNWGQSIKLMASDKAQGDNFGHSAVIEGLTLIVGASLDDDMGSNSGSAYIFDCCAGPNFSQTAKLTASNGAANAEFGDSVALAGNVAIIGAPFINIAANPGTAYKFERPGVTSPTWSQTEQYTPSDGDTLDRFGNAVGFSGDTALIGSDGDDQRAVNAGAVYLFRPALVADLAIAKSVAPAVALPGQPVTYTLNYTNLSPQLALNVVITDTIPLTLTNVSYTSSRPVTPTGGLPYVWQAGSLRPAESGTITVTGRVAPGISADTQFTNTARISSSLPDLVPDNNVAQVALAVVVPRIQFSQASYFVTENQGVATITVTLNQVNPFAAAVVQYATANGTASSNDYGVRSGTLTLPAGTTSATFTVSITDDLRPEDDETVLLSLSNASGAVLASPPNATLTILDNDSVVYLPMLMKGVLPGTLPIQITAAIPGRPVQGQGETFFTRSLVVDYQGGRLFLASNPDGTGATFVDDRIVLSIQHADGSTATFIHTYVNSDLQGTPLLPTDIASYFEPGANTVSATLRDVYAAQVASSALWLTR